MNNRNDEMAEWLNEPSSTSDDKTLDWFFEYYVLSEQETLTDQEKVKLSALKKSLFGDGAPTNEELSQYPYLFANAPAQTQAGQVVASSKRGRQTGSKSVNPCRNALKKFWEKKGRPSAKHIIAAIHDFDYHIPNEFNLIKQGDYVIYRVNTDDDDITKYKYKISSIERDLIAQFSKE